MLNKLKNKHNLIIIVVIFALLIIDQITKIIFFKQGLNIANEVVEDQNNNYYIVLSIIIILVILRYISSNNNYIKLDTKLILSFAIAGGMGNLIDRIWNKEVINFIKIWHFMHLNLAYIYIIIAWVGMAVILTKNSMIFIKDRKAKKEKLNEFGRNNSKK